MSSIWYHLGGRLGNQLFQLSFAYKMAEFYNKPVTFFTDQIHKIPDYGFNAVEVLSSPSVSGVLESPIRGRILQYSDRLFSRDKERFKAFNARLNILRSMQAFEIPELPSRAPSLVTGFCINSNGVLSSNEFLTCLREHLDVISVDKFWTKLDPYQVLHIRGTDLKGSVYGSLSKKYYNSIDFGEMPVIVLTDDLDHAKILTQELTIHQFLSPTELNPWEALSVMRNSKKIYVSNSTLAWWGAYLSLDNKGEVVLPRPFYKGSDPHKSPLHVEGFTYFNSDFD